MAVLLTTSNMSWLLWTGLLFSTLTETALCTSDVMVATLGGSVTLPCAASNGPHCSSVTWTRINSDLPLVSAGQERAPNIKLLRNCSLQISNIHDTNVTTYKCGDGKNISSVDLRILDITEKNDTAEGQIELHCFLNSNLGLMPEPECNMTGLLVNWVMAENNTAIRKNSSRFNFERSTNCFLKLYIRPKKKTDHHRKWRCQVSQNGSAKATASYITTVKNGLEEVFAAVGESLSLSCASTSSLSLTEKGQTTSTTYSPPASFISYVSPVAVGDYYHCINNKKSSNIRLHRFQIISELEPGGKNLTLSCVLTCANGMCDEDFDLTWSEDHRMYSNLSRVKGSLIIKLSIPLIQLGSAEAVCFVLREGFQVASKRWRQNNSVPSVAWIMVPILLLCVAAVGVFWVCRKRKHNEDPETIGMTSVYEEVKDYEPPHKREAVTSNDSFYDLLQAVN